MKHKKSIYIDNRGCIRRALDAEKFARYYRENGYKISKNPKNSDQILFITCAFRKFEEDIMINNISNYKKHKAKLIVAGCLKGINRERLLENFKGDSLVTCKHHEIDNIYPEFQVQFNNISDSNNPKGYSTSKLQMIKEYFRAIRIDYNFLMRVKEHLLRRYSSKRCYIRISSGCINEHCTYCSIWRSVGNIKSKAIPICIDEIDKNIKLGYYRIALVADNLGAWGIDIGLTFIDLLNKISEIQNNFVLELEDFHPYWLIKYIDDIPSEIKIDYALIPVQSGNNRILKLMNRRHTVGDAQIAISKLKKKYPNIKLHTQIILGFPSETEKEFLDTLKFIKKNKFKLVQVYGYSHNPYIKDIDLLNSRLPHHIIEDRVKRAIKYFIKNRIPAASS